MYKAAGTIKHNGRYYYEGDEVVGLSEEQAKVLVDQGVLVSEGAEVAPEQESTPDPLEGAPDSSQNEPPVESPEQPTQPVTEPIQTTQDPELLQQIAQDAESENSSDASNLDIQ